MGALGNLFKSPAVPQTAIPDAAASPTLADPSVAATAARARAKLASQTGMGFGDTLRTSSMGVTAPTTAKDKLTGQSSSVTKAL